jgi:hypothetical protein
MEKEKVKVKKKRNKFRIRVKKCCMSCAYKDLTRCMGKRFCVKHEMDVKRDFYCTKWRMSHTQRMAGFARGSVKCREYLMFVLAVREDEALAIERGEEIEVKALDELRAEFLENHGEIYEFL